MGRVFRWIGIIVGVLIAVIVVAGVVLYFRGNSILNQNYDFEVAALEIPTGADAIAEGERIYVTRGCAGCHGEDGAGSSFFEGAPIATLYTSNLTSAGSGANYGATDYVRAIQHGIGADGRVLIGMPSEYYQSMRVTEITALMAYLQSMTPVENDLPQSEIQFLGRVLMGIGVYPPPAAALIDHSTAGPVDISDEVSVELGANLAEQLCTNCHGSDLAGQPLSWDPSIITPNITFHPDGIEGWTRDDMVALMRDGVLPGNVETEGAGEHAANYSTLTDDELESIFLYLEAAEPLPSE